MKHYLYNKEENILLPKTTVRFKPCSESLPARKRCGSTSKPLEIQDRLYLLLYLQLRIELIHSEHQKTYSLYFFHLWTQNVYWMQIIFTWNFLCVARKRFMNLPQLGTKHDTIIKHSFISLGFVPFQGAKDSNSLASLNKNDWSVFSCIRQLILFWRKSLLETSWRRKLGLYSA